MVNSKVESYIEEICSYVKFKRAHREIKLEILNHIEEKAEDLMLQGMNAEEASKKAIADMGQAELIGRQLDQSHKAAPEWGLLVMSTLFSLLGVVIIYLIVSNKVIEYSSPLYNSIRFSIIGFIVLFGLYFFDYKKMEKHSLKIYIGVTLVLLIQLLIAVPVSGRKAWLPLGPFSLNITQLSLYVYVVSLSKLIRSLDLKRIKGYLYLSLMLIVPFILYISLRTSMEALVYFVLFIVLMFISKVNLSYIFSAAGLFLSGCLYTALREPYRIKRLLIFMNPESDPTNSGFLNMQIQRLLSSTGLTGNGFTFPKRFLPEAHTDFVLTYIIYTFGWLAGIALIMLVVTFMLRMFAAAREVRDSYGRFIIQGFLCIFALEFVWNILMVLGFAPIISVGLPFISYGSSNTLAQMAAVGLMMSIYRAKSLSYAA